MIYHSGIVLWNSVLGTWMVHLESTRIPEDLVQTATHLRAPVHPTCFLSLPSIVVLELSTGQSLVLSVCLDGDWLELSGTR